MDAALIVVTLVLLLAGMGASMGRFAGRGRRRVWSDVGRSVGLAESAESTSKQILSAKNGSFRRR